MNIIVELDRDLDHHSKNAIGATMPQHAGPMPGSILQEHSHLATSVSLSIREAVLGESASPMMIRNHDISPLHPVYQHQHQKHTNIRPHRVHVATWGLSERSMAEELVAPSQSRNGAMPQAC
jgi:hypothetical protein